MQLHELLEAALVERPGRPAGVPLAERRGRLEQAGGFCPTCGIVPYGHVPASQGNPSAYVSVNVAALDDLDPRELMAAPIQYCDGRNDNWWEKPDFVAHV